MANDARIILSQTWSVTAAQLGVEDEHDDEVGENHLRESDPDSLGDGQSVSYNLIIFLVIGLPSLLLAYLLLRSFY
jgi:hypothetical protein